MTASCEVLSEWMKSNKLKLNAEKTHILTVGTQQKLSSLPRKLEVTMDRVVLQNDNVGYEMLLGCKVQENMKWSQQVEMLLNKLSKRLVGLQNLRLICPYVLRKTITEGLFNSILAYCLPLYGGMDSGLSGSYRVFKIKLQGLFAVHPLVQIELSSLESWTG